MKNKSKLIFCLIICCFAFTGCSSDNTSFSINSNPYDPIFIDYKGTKEVEKIELISTTNEAEHIAE